MTRFCGVSEHRINLEMSKAFFSRNVNFNRALKLSEKLGVGLTGNLGKYLGVPLLHARASKVNYEHITKKAKLHLASWKGRFLNIADRTVLIGAVLSALPSYQMQLALLPKGVIKELERLSRTFL